MKIVEHTSNHLTLKNSAAAVWVTRLLCSPFLFLGCVGLWIVISEKSFPNFFIIFCFVTGFIGVFFTSKKTLCFDKTQNKLSIQTEKILGRRKTEYLLNEISVRVKETPFSRKVSYSTLTVTTEPICVIILEIASNSKIIFLYFTINKAVEIADVIRRFLNTK